ncbi:MAG: calcium-binding protein [Alphaproteobacteria bacterium]|nr:calcium-binding protein [Alphaproteobacteria bacterium]
MAIINGTNSGEMLNGDPNFVGEDDIINGLGGDDVINGLGGNDVIDGGTGADSMAGGVGDDTYYVDNAGDFVAEGLGMGTDLVVASINYTLTADVENLVLATGAANGTGNGLANVITGNDAVNLLTGGSGNDTLYGNGGSDILDGGLGADTMHGGTGNDTFMVDNGGDVVVELSGEGVDLVVASVNHTLAANVENLTLTAGAVWGTGNAANNTITGDGADNTLQGLDGNDTLVGNGGNDTLDGGLGADSMAGGLGNDTYKVDDAGDVVTELSGEGSDWVDASINYTLGAHVENLMLLGSAVTGTGNALNNVLIGNNSANTLSGLDGDDFIDGSGGSDTMVGGLGNDTYVVGSAGDVVTELAGQGTDTVRSSITYILGANVENLTLLGSSNINGTGNELDNVITGNSGNNQLFGLDGNDTISTGGGHDYVDGGAGADTMNGGSGNDTYVVESAGDVVSESSGQGTDKVLSLIDYVLTANVENLTLLGAAVNGTGNAGNNAIVGNDLDNSLTGLDGNDYLDGGIGADTMVGGLGDDTYVIDNTGDVTVENPGEGTDTIVTPYDTTLAAEYENLTLVGGALVGTGNQSDNIIIGNAEDNVLTGLEGNDTLDGGAGIDTMVGGVGDDTYGVDNAADVVTELADEGTDTVRSSIAYTLGATLENLTLVGSASVDATGNSGDNVIVGNSGNNVINGLAGADTMSGGGGDDTFIVDNLGDTVSENASQGTDLVQSSVSFTLGANVENLILTGATVISGTGNELNNVITGNTAGNTLRGGDGNDTLDGGAGGDTLEGEGGNDTLLGGAASDTLRGGDGDDYLDGGTGFDSMNGGAGNDTFIVDSVSDTISEAADGGIDQVFSSVTFTLGSNVENMTLTGSANINATGNTLANVLVGNSGNNRLAGGLGADTMSGGLGNDTYTVDNVGDVVTELADEGTDLVESSISYTLGAHVENLTLTGGAAVSGTGNALDNVLTGNLSANRLDGGLGADTMAGGNGNDTYVVDNLGDVVTENLNAGTDTVEVGFDYTLGANLENLVLTGTAIQGTGNDLNNVITGNAEANILGGLDGNDTLNGGAGADLMVGGLGNDTYVVDDAGDIAVEAENEGTDLVQSSVTYALATNLENLTLTGSGNIDGYGNAVANVLVGNTGANILDGGEGADSMTGGAGNDTYYVDDAGDTVTEAGSAGTDLVVSTISYTLGANLENLTLAGTADIDGTGNVAANTILGNAGVNTLTGNDGNDYLDGGEGADTMVGGTGADTYVRDNAGDVIVELASQGIDTVQTTLDYTLDANIENATVLGAIGRTLTGSTGANVLTGGDGNDTLNGLEGGDTLNGGVGADTLIGGTGNDTYVVDNAGDVIVEGLGGGTDMVQSSIDYTLNTYLENLTLIGTGTINGTGNVFANQMFGNSAANTLWGGGGGDSMGGNGGDDIMYGEDGNDRLAGHAGNDYLDGGNGTDIADYSSASGTITIDLEIVGAQNTGWHGTDTLVSIESVYGGSGADVLYGDGVLNTLVGNAGNDYLDGRGGVDWLYGGAGDDTYIVDNSGDLCFDFTGTDTVLASATFRIYNTVDNLTLTGTDNIDGTGNSLANVITGNAGVNVLTGLDGNDILDGGAGIDSMYGGNGNDTYYVDNASEIVSDASGTDLVIASVSFSLFSRASIEDLTLTGSATQGIGNANANVLTGNDLVNDLRGNDGNDTIIGGVGADQLQGGNGADIFALLAVADSTGVFEGRDVILDWNEAAGDKIDLSAIDANTLLADDQAFTFIGTGAFTGAGQIRYDSTATNTIIYAEVNGDGIADISIRLAGVSGGVTGGAFIY